MDHWLIDNGTSRNFTRYKEALSILGGKKNNLNIILGDNSTYTGKGIGTVTFPLNYGQIIHLHEVLYVPDLKNTMSIYVMEYKGFMGAFIDENVHIWHRNPKDYFTLVLGFKVSIKLVEVLWEIWQVILLFKVIYGTEHFPTYITNMVRGMPRFNMKHEGLCQGCAFGKHTKRPLSSCERRKIYILQLIDSNISSIFPITSLRGYTYYAIFVDDFSLKKWLFISKHWWKIKQVRR